MTKEVHPVVHFELGCDNLKQTEDFYRNTFNWELTSLGTSALVNTNSEVGIQGHITVLGHEPKKYVNIYIQTADIDFTLKNVEANGGKSLLGPITLPDGRKFAWFLDVAGNSMGLITKS